MGILTCTREIVHLNTFGEKQFKEQGCEEVKMDIQGLDGDFALKMRALAFPVICSPVATQVDVTEFPHLDGLKFVDEIHGTSETFDILL